MENIFNEKTVIVTGGASGIGRELVLQLSTLGARVTIIDKDAIKGAELANALKSLGVIYLQADMANPVDAERVINKIVKNYTTIDYLFNNAGIFMGGEIRDTPLSDWQTVVNNNIWAVYNGTHYGYQQMLKQGSGYIINVASAAGLFPVPAMGIYGSSKFAIVGLSHALRAEARDFGINVSVVCPTIVDTPLYDTAIYNRLHIKKALSSRQKAQSADVAARRILEGVIKNRQTIHTAVSTRIGALIYRLSPTLYSVGARRALRSYRQNLRDNS